jgi:hypothetical protein
MAARSGGGPRAALLLLRAIQPWAADPEGCGSRRPWRPPDTGSALWLHMQRQHPVKQAHEFDWALGRLPRRDTPARAHWRLLGHYVHTAFATGAAAACVRARKPAAANDLIPLPEPVEPPAANTLWQSACQQLTEIDQVASYAAQTPAPPGAVQARHFLKQSVARSC